MSIGIGTKIGMTYGGPYGAGAGVLFDISWYTAPHAYRLTNNGLNNFKSAINQMESGLKSGAIPHYLWRR